jgi:hypothetical protein
MKKLNKYDDFLFDSLLESVGDGEMPFALSIRLAELLHDLDHKIAHKLLDDDNDKSYSKITLLDYDDEREDMFTFTTSPKLIQYYKDNYDSKDGEIRTNFRIELSKTNNLFDINRSNMKIGRLVAKLYPDMFSVSGKPGEDIESFVDLVKSSRTKTEGEFKIVKGKDIVKYYDKSSYESNIGGSTLAGSCMAGSHCSRYIEFYNDNDVEMVMLMSDKEEDKIIGRAILWTIHRINDKSVNRKFMDRIYYTQYSDVSKFIELAKKNNWLYKNTQDFYSETDICDPETDTYERLSLYTEIDEDYSGPYPYMDTLKYFIKDKNILTNNDDKYDWELTSTGGGYDEYNGSDYLWNDSYGEFVSHDDMMWSDVEDRYLETEDALWIEDLNSYVSDEYAGEHLAYITDEDEWVKKENAVFIKSNNEYVSTEYAMENYAHCSYDDKYYDYDECYPSENHGSVPTNKAIKVFTILDLDWEEINNDGDMFDVGDYADWRYEGDETYFEMENENGKKYNFDEEFLDRFDKIRNIINKDT